jgi:hypothetical protein
VSTPQLRTVTLRLTVVGFAAVADDQILSKDYTVWISKVAWSMSATCVKNSYRLTIYKLGVLASALAQVGADKQSRTEYEQNLLPLVYGSAKPHFDEAFASFEKVAGTFLNA